MVSFASTDRVNFGLTNRVTVVLAWPDSRLNPNARTHKFVLARLKASTREEAGFATVGQLPLATRRAIAAGEGVIPIEIVFHPPDARRHDIDNMLARAKASLDGLADGLRVDDYRFEPTLKRGVKVKGGCLEIML